MKHYVLIKFKPNYCNEELLEYTKDVFSKIEKLENISNVIVHSNCIERDSNMDMMIEMDLKYKETLNYYLEHDIHIDFVNKIKDNVVSKVSFDCE